MNSKKTKKVLDKTPSPRYNTPMKYALAFVLGMLAHAYVMPPQPQVELDDMDIEKISWILLDKLEAQGYNITLAKQELTQPKRGWFN
jgi:hypothetical protein|tara:strand:- start:610 stop:870 length:261 start_codon:yes stop_codon:yes gene_type:complete